MPILLISQDNMTWDAPLPLLLQSQAPSPLQPMPQPQADNGSTVSGPKEYIDAVRNAIAGMPTGNGWSIRVVPPGQWKLPTDTVVTGHSPHAYSDLGSWVTYLRADSLHDLSPFVVKRILAHELGHLTLNTSDEAKANKWADNWMANQ